MEAACRPGRPPPAPIVDRDLLNQESKFHARTSSGLTFPDDLHYAKHTTV